MDEDIKIVSFLKRSETIQGRLDELFCGECHKLGIEILPTDIKNEFIEDFSHAMKKNQTRAQFILDRPDLLTWDPSLKSVEAIINVAQVLRVISILECPKDIIKTSIEFTKKIEKILQNTPEYKRSIVRLKLGSIQIEEESEEFNQDIGSEIYWKCREEIFVIENRDEHVNIDYFFQPFRLSHKDWFFYDDENKTDWYHPFLLIVLREYLEDTKRIRRMPSGWLNGEDICHFFGMSKKEFDNFSQILKHSHPTWVEVFLDEKGSKYVGYAPQFKQELLRFNIPIQKSDSQRNWITINKVSNECKKSAEVLIKLSKTFDPPNIHCQEVYPKQAKVTYVSDIFASWVTFISLQEAIIRSTYKTRHDFNKSLSSRFTIANIDEAIDILYELLPNESLLNPNKKGNNQVYYGPEFDIQLQEYLETHYSEKPLLGKAPAGWLVEKRVIALLNTCFSNNNRFGQKRVREVFTEFKKNHPNWIQPYFAPNKKICDYFSPLFIACIQGELGNEERKMA